MREILQSGARGISREELCSKWAVSSMNDYPWEEATFQRTRQWLSIGLCPDGIYFYIVSDEQDYELREQRAEQAGAHEGVRYRRGYWWHEMKDPELFCMPYSAVPDFNEISRRGEYILSQLSNVK